MIFEFKWVVFFFEIFCLILIRFFMFFLVVWISVVNFLCVYILLFEEWIIFFFLWNYLGIMFGMCYRDGCNNFYLFLLKL